MTDYEENAQTPDFKDRKTGLVVFGILQILLGALCAAMVPFMIFAMAVSLAVDNADAPPTNPLMMLPSILIYALLAAWFITMGIGSLKARRWARALIFSLLMALAHLRNIRTGVLFTVHARYVRQHG